MTRIFMETYQIEIKFGFWKKSFFFLFFFTSGKWFEDSGYPHDGRADKNPYPHRRRADKDSYPHDSTGAWRYYFSLLSRPGPPTIL